MLILCFSYYLPIRLDAAIRKHVHLIASDRIWSSLETPSFELSSFGIRCDRSLIFIPTYHLLSVSAIYMSPRYGNRPFPH